MTPLELRSLLQEFHKEKLSLLGRHEAVARHVGNLDVNNTYQYIIAREETHLSWIRSAIEDLGGVASDAGDEPSLDPRGPEALLALIREDAAGAARFVAAWAPRVEQMTNARHRGTLRIVLGETLEHKRFFDQAAAGRDDLLGRRMHAGPRRGAVIDRRWLGQ